MLKRSIALFVICLLGLTVTSIAAAHATEKDQPVRDWRECEKLGYPPTDKGLKECQDHDRPDRPEKPKEDKCHEDEPCWDCKTMGNKICGPQTSTTTSTLPPSTEVTTTTQPTTTTTIELIPPISIVTTTSTTTPVESPSSPDTTAPPSTAPEGTPPQGGSPDGPPQTLPMTGMADGAKLGAGLLALIFIAIGAAAVIGADWWENREEDEEITDEHFWN